MIVKFQMTCQVMDMPPHLARQAEEKLQTYRSSFAGKTYKVSGVNAPHFLLKTKNRGKKKKRCSMKSKSRSFHPDDTDSLKDLTCRSSVSEARMATAGGKCTAGFGATAKRTPLTSMTLQSFPLCGPQ
jgi:hypothetical protein